MSSPDSNNKLIGKYGKDTLVYIPALIVPAILNVISVMLFTRIFSTADFGLFNLIITTTQLLSMVMSQWVIQSVQFYRPSYIKENNLRNFNNNLMKMLFLLTFSTFIFSVILYLIYLVLITEQIGRFSILYWCSVLIVILQGIFKIGLAIFQSDLKADKFRFYQLLNSIIKFSLPIAIIYFVAKDIISILIGTIISIFIIIIPIFKQSKLIPTYSFNITQDFKAFSKKFMNYGFPMIGWFVGTSILTLSDKYMIGYFRGSSEVGIYSANTSIVFYGIGLLSGPLLSAAHPIIMNSKSENSLNEKKFQQIINDFSRFFVLSMIPISVFIASFRYEIATILLGENYREGANIIPIVLFGFMIWQFSLYGHKGHEVLGKTRDMVIYVFVSVIVNIILNAILIPMYGYIGAAIATLVGYLVYPILIYYSSKSLIAWKIPWLSITRVTISSVLTASISNIIIREYFNYLSPIVILIVSACIWLIIYILFLILINEIKKSEIKTLNVIFRKIIKK